MAGLLVYLLGCRGAPDLVEMGELALALLRQLSGEGLPLRTVRLGWHRRLLWLRALGIWSGD